MRKYNPTKLIKDPAVKKTVIMGVTSGVTVIAVRHLMQMIPSENEVGEFILENKYIVGILLILIGLMMMKTMSAVSYEYAAAIIVVGFLQLFDDLFVRFFNADIV